MTDNNYISNLNYYSYAITCITYSLIKTLERVSLSVLNNKQKQVSKAITFS